VSFYLDAGETVYVTVEPSSDDSYNTGTYAVRYYAVAAVAPQTAPLYVKAQGTPGSTNVVTWSAVDGATDYNVYRSTVAGGGEPYSFRGTVPHQTYRYYTDTGVTAGTTYYYKVSAVNGSGEGPLSPAVSDTIPVPAVGTGTLLTLNGWNTAGNLTTVSQVDWYKITIGTAGTYSLQWDASYEGSGTYSGDIWVSVFQADGTPLFTDMSSGYTTPRSGYLAGGTVYVRVEPYGHNSGSIGTYAIRYHQ
jgi:hypothetical protein